MIKQWKILQFKVRDQLIKSVNGQFDIDLEFGKISEYTMLAVFTFPIYSVECLTDKTIWTLGESFDVGINMPILIDEFEVLQSKNIPQSILKVINNKLGSWDITCIKKWQHLY